MSVWFVTGASRGFGAEIVKEALARGNQVAARAVFDHPPLRIQLGADPVSRVEAKLDFVRAELERWRKFSLSTDHEDVPHA
jgi:NAD(P)-dependent dehydrogenase (short-subunit alcohol dehydrogenase family)